MPRPWRRFRADARSTYGGSLRADRAQPLAWPSTSARQHHLADAVTARARSELGKTDETRTMVWHVYRTIHRAPMTVHPEQRAARALTRTFRSAPTATRTRDLLLRRHSRNVAWYGPAWPDVPGRLQRGWLDVAWRGPATVVTGSPRAPQNIVIRANFCQVRSRRSASRAVLGAYLVMPPVWWALMIGSGSMLSMITRMSSGLSHSQSCSS